MFDHQLADAERQSMRHLAKTIMDQLGAGRPADEIVRELQNNDWDFDHAKEFVDHIAANQEDFSNTLEMRFPDLKPTKSPPPLFTINGFGLGLYGARDRDSETRTHVKTLCICGLFVPLIPLASYRVAPAPGSRAWYMIGRVPLSRFAKAWNLLLVLAILGAVGYSMWVSHMNTPAYRARQQLDRANKAWANGDWRTAARLYRDVSLSYTSASEPAREKIVQLVENPRLTRLPHGKVIDLFQFAAAGVRNDALSSRVVERGFALADRYLQQTPVDSLRLLGAVAQLDPKRVGTHLVELLSGPLSKIPADRVAVVYRAAWEVASDVGNENAVKDCAWRWFDDNPNADPAGALTLADLLARAPGVEPAKAQTLVRRQLERVVVADPKNVSAAERLAVLLEKEGKTNRLESLLSPVRDQLGDGEGARILGHILANQGKYDESYSLLSPYLESRLSELHQAESRFRDAMTAAQDAAVELLQRGDASGFDYAKYESSSKNEKKQLVFIYVNQRIKEDAAVQRTRDELTRMASVVSVALDVGMIELLRARAMKDPRQRRKELERAEKIFLSVQSLAGDTDSYRLNIGQVYYWLGKQKEGRQEFDQLLKKHQRSYDILMSVGRVMRELGADSEARKLADEAYKKADTDAARYDAALMREVLSNSPTEKLTWLERCDPSLPATKAERATLRGQRAVEAGHEDEAVRYYERAISTYESMTETSTMLNNGALVCFTLYDLNHDRATFNKGMRWMERAVALSPSNSLLLGNAADSILTAAIRDIAGPKLDLRRFGGSADPDDLLPLATDQTALARLREKVRQHEGVRKAIDYFSKQVVLSPRRTRPYAQLRRIFRFTRDRQRLEQLAKQLESADLDVADNRDTLLKYYQFMENPDIQAAMQSRLRHAKQQLQQARAAHHDLDGVVLWPQLLSLQSVAHDVVPIDCDAAVQSAESLQNKVPSVSTYQLLIYALLLRADRTLATRFPEYAQASAKARRSLSPAYTVVLALTRDGALATAARDNPDVRHVAALFIEFSRKFPDQQTPWIWALLQATQPDAAAKVAQFLADDAMGHLSREISFQLSPLQATDAYDLYWERRATGHDATARTPIDQVIQRGVPIPKMFVPR